MSTGMATLAEISEAVNVIKASNCKNFALLKCTSKLSCFTKRIKSG